MTFTGKEILNLGFEEGKEVALAIEIANTLLDTQDEEVVNIALKRVLEKPESFMEDRKWAALANQLIEKNNVDPVIELNETPVDLEIFGQEHIEQGALDQIHVASKLPVAKSAALMPDAHQGYGLPIGGVLATDNAIIPYAVGVDIGCRMCLSIYEIDPEIIEEKEAMLSKMLNRNTAFGRQTVKNRKDHEVLHNDLFSEIPLIKGLKEKAASQIGSSGGGNHFVEFGIVEIKTLSTELGLEPGSYLALLSHSGSRGLGATIANHYTKLAMQETKLPDEAKHLAWLDLNTELGQEYWLAMNLAGDYASACHHQIHERMSIGLRIRPAVMVENHHNFAWKELDHEGKEVIVHRKGATPAGEGVLGVIPGSMTAPGYIVRGKGDPRSIASASHGAGRTMSRTKAKNTLDHEEVNKFLADRGVKVIGSGLDEAPMAYKDIDAVMACQQDLVDVLGSFHPKIVRMCGDKGFFEVD